MNSTNPQTLLHQFIRIVLVAAAYYLLAQSTFAVNLPQITPAVWIPTAVALLVVFIGGWQMGIGLFVGAFLFRIGIKEGPTVAPFVAAAIAAGLTAQSWAGAWLLRKVVKKLAPQTVRETTKALGVLFFTTAIAPFFHATSVLATGEISTLAEYLITVLAWWLPTFTGVIIIVPGVLVLWQFMRTREQVAHAMLWPIAGMIIGLNLIIFSVSYTNGQWNINRSLENDAEEIAHVLRDAAVYHEAQNVIALSGLLSASIRVSRTEFRSFVDTLSEKFFFGRGLAWAPRVTAQERGAFEEAMRADGIADYFIHELDAAGNKIPATQRVEYFPLTYIEPVAENGDVLGLDNSAIPERMEALEQARDSGEFAVTRPLRLQQGSGNLAILVAAPVYQKGPVQDSLQARRDNLQGFVLGAFLVDKIVQTGMVNIHANDTNLAVYMYDITEADAPIFMAYYDVQSGEQKLSEIPRLDSLHQGLFRSHDFPIGGRTWHVVVRAMPGYTAGTVWWYSWMGLLIGFVLAGAFLAYANADQRAEKITQESEAKFRAISENSPNGVLQQDRNRRTIYANQAIIHMLGLETFHELVQIKAKDFTVDPNRYYELFDKVLACGQVINEELDVRTKQGEIRHLLFTASLSGDVVTSSLTDVTERTQAQREIQQLSRIVSQMADAVIITNTQGVIEYVNPAFEELTGYSRAEAIGQTPRILKSGVHNQEFYRRFWETILRGEILQVELTNRRKNGGLYSVFKTITPLRNADGKITHFLATGKDITERKQIEQALMRRDAEYRLIAENTGDVIWVLDMESQHFTYVSPSVERLRGLTPEEALAQPMESSLTPESLIRIAAVLPARLDEFVRTGKKKTYTDELEQFHKDGSIIQTEVSSSFALSEEGKVQVVGISRDIRERVQADRQQETAYRIAEAAQKADSLQELYPQIHEQIKQVMYAENFYIGLYDEATALVSFPYMVDEKVAPLRDAYPLRNSVTGYVVRNRRPLLFRQGDETEEVQVHLEPCACWLGVPLNTGGKTIGVMSVQHYTDIAAYSERDERMLEFVSTQIAIAIERKQAEEREWQQQQQMAYHYRLVEILNTISTRFINLPQEEIDVEIDHALKMVGEFEEVDRSYLFLFEDDHILMNNTHEWCAPGITPEIEKSQGISVHSFPWWLEQMERGDAVHIPLVSHLPPEAQSLQTALESQGVQSLLAVPLLHNRWLFGFVGFDMVRTTRAWDADSILLIKMLGDIFSNALVRKKNEESIRHSERRNRALIENAPDGIALLDTNGCFLFGSPSAARMFGYELADLLGAPSSTLMHPDDLHIALEIRQIYTKTPSEVTTRSYRVRRKDGVYRWIEATYTNLLDEPGVNALVVNFRDITEQKAAQDSLRQSENRFSTIFDSSPVSISIARLSDHKIVEVNRSWCEQWGHSREDALGQTAIGLGVWVEPQDRERLLGELMVKARVLEFETLLRRKSGEVRNVLLSAEVVEINGEPSVLLQIFDITEREQALALLEKSQASLEAAQSIAHLGSWELDPTTGIGVWSREMFTLFHLDPTLGTPHLPQFMHLVHEDDRQKLLDAETQAIRSGEMVVVEYRSCQTGDQMRFFQATINPVLDADGQLRHISGTVLDVTESRLLQIAIQERVKELTCLFNISRLLNDTALPEETLGNMVVNHLVSAMRYPEITVARLELHGKQYITPGYSDSLTYFLHAPILVYGESQGFLHVYYTEARDFIIPEEQSMLDNISLMLGFWLERREAEAAQNASEQRFRQLADNIQEVFRMFDMKEQKIIYISPAYEQIWGRTCADLYQDNSGYIQGILPEDRPIMLDIMQKQAQGESTETEYRVQRPDGSIRWVWDRSFPVFDEDGRLIRQAGVATDVTDVKNAQHALEELNRDLERRVEERTQEVRRSSELFAQFMRHSPVYTFVKEVTPTSSVIRHCSANFVEMTGIPAAEMLGRSMQELFPPELAQKMSTDDWAVVASNQMTQFDEELNGRNYQTIKFPIAQGEKTLLAGYTIDITERKQAEVILRESRDRLSAANAALERASRMKDEFLASMSHELRTPLTGILGLSEALQMQTYGTLTDRQLRALKNIESSGRHLLDLINDILDLSKIEAGKLEMHFEIYSVAEICQASLQLVKGMAQQKKQNIAHSINPATITVRTDIRRLKQMLVNLLSNAIKFTPENGKIGLDVEANAEEKTVTFTIWDKGIGISPENMSKLFKPFLQLDSSLARQYSGTGLGLSLVQRMAELHGGSVRVESSLGEGSRFSIILPLANKAATPQPRPLSGDLSILKNALILEDNLLDAEHVMRYMNDLGIANIHQPTLQGAFARVIAIRPGVILLDVNLPDGSGMDLLARLQGDERTRTIPVIMASVEERQSEATALGASGYLVKPFSQKELRDELAKAAAQTESHSPVLVVSSPDRAPTVLLADDNETILETLSDFLRSVGYKVVATRSGFELLERAPETQPDVILVDIQMPGLDGIETIRRLRRSGNPTLTQAPIIAVTALAMTGDREKCIEAGANEYLSKPVFLQQLAKSIRQLIEKKAEAVKSEYIAQSSGH